MLLRFNVDHPVKVVSARFLRKTYNVLHFCATIATVAHVVLPVCPSSGLEYFGAAQIALFAEGKLRVLWLSQPLGAWWEVGRFGNGGRPNGP